MIFIYLCHMDKIKIYLTKDEKLVLGHVKAGNTKPPQCLSNAMFLFVLSSLRDKGLVEYKSSYTDVLSARLTIKGAALIESNPELENPTDWVKWVTLACAAITAVATSLSLIHC